MPIIEISEVPVIIKSTGGLKGQIRWSTLRNPCPYDNDGWSPWSEPSKAVGQVARFIETAKPV